MPAEGSRQIKWSQYRKKDKTTPHCHSTKTATCESANMGMNGNRVEEAVTLPGTAISNT